MKRLLSAVLALGVAATMMVATPGSAATVPQSGEGIVVESPGETSAACCWIYVFGRWWCVPCG